MTKSIKLSSLIATGKLWEKGEHSRIYLNESEVATLLGFTWARYKTGNIKRAAFDGEEIYNAEMRRVFGALEGVYYDNHTKKLGSARFFFEMLKSYDIELVDDVNVEPEEDDALSTKNTHGGRREGAGRKPTGHVARSVQLSPEQAETFKQLGGSAFLRTLLDEIIEGTLAIPVDTAKFTDEQKDRFIKGWEQAGGPTDDGECSDPWCCPWFWKPTIIVHGTTPEEWGADFYRQCKPELDAILAEEDEE